MKNIILSFLLFCSTVNSQNWNNIVTTSINEPNLQKMDLFTNKSGNNIIVQNSNSSNSIKYYLLNSAGSIVRSSTIETAGNAEFSNISGNNNIVYVFYKLGNNLKAKYSTNAGQSWTPIVDKAIGANTCNALDIAYGNDGVHLVYATQDSYPDYETHYYRINSNGDWVDYKNVTDHSSLQYGGFPTVSVSQNRVHVSVNTGQGSDPTGNNGISMERDKYYSNWQTPQSVFNPGSMSEKIGNSNTKLFNFYYEYISDMGYHSDLYVKERTLSGTTWSSGTLIQSWANVESLVSITNTSDNKSHIVYEGTLSVSYRNYNGSSWSSESTIATDGYSNPTISSVSNDLFVVYKSYSSGYVKYLQYDTNPLSPQNLIVSANGYFHPVLTWNANTEPDLSGYQVWRKQNAGGSWTLIGSPTTNSFTDNQMLTNLPYSDIYYKIRAKDIQNHYSDYSLEVNIKGTLNKSNDDVAEANENAPLPTEYKLAQNYPNPFNPSTKIVYDMPKNNQVSLKVYNSLGKEVSELVNGFQQAGSYSVTFDASNLPSGVYFYKLQVGDFIQSKKMLIIK
jgi:hypothetical protein